MNKLVALQGSMPTVGSVQEVLECLVDKSYAGTDGRMRLKLLFPLMYWFAYPPLMVCWVIMLAWIQSRTIFQVRNFIKRREAKKKARKKQLNQENDEDEDDFYEYQSSSDDDEEDKYMTQKGENSKEVPERADWDNLGRSMNHLVILPNRFHHGRKKAEESTKGALSDEEGVRPGYIFNLYRPGANLLDTVVDIGPWIVITLNNVWLPVTNRLLQVLSCEKFPDPKTDGIKAQRRLLMATEIPCVIGFSGDYGMLFLIGIGGLIAWSLGIVAGLYTVINNRELQSDFVQRTFGYLLEGYEPRSWWWEMIVKKIDLLVVAIITFTSLANDPRAKLLLYAFVALIAVMVQIAYSPYDNRQVNLLDRVENLGLFSRATLFCGVAFCLLLDSPSSGIFSVSFFVACLIIFTMIVFMAKLVVHSCDDWIATQWVNLMIKIYTKIKEERLYNMGRGKKMTPMDCVYTPQAELDQALAPTTTRQGIVLNKFKHSLSKFRRIFFPEYRQAQLNRFNWRGPTSDAALKKPPLSSGYKAKSAAIQDAASLDELPLYIEMQLKVRKWLFSLGDDSQLDFAVSNITNFVHLLVVSAKFQQLPALLTDMLFLLSASAKRLRSEMVYNPPVKAKKRKHQEEKKEDKDKKNKSKKKKHSEELDESTSSSEGEMSHDHGPMRKLKAAILEEMFDERSRLRAEQQDRKTLLNQIERSLHETLEIRGIPPQLASEILSRMSTRQLRLALPNPNQLLIRIDIFVMLLQCDNACSETLKRIAEKRKVTNDDREKVTKFMEHTMRSLLENEALLNWQHVATVLDKLPVEDVEAYASNGSGCLEMVQAQVSAQEQVDDEPIEANAITVEDLNTFVMFVEKFSWEQLQEVLEYTQVLIDFLHLPNTHQVWQCETYGKYHAQLDDVAGASKGMEKRSERRDRLKQEILDDIARMEALADEATKHPTQANKVAPLQSLPEMNNAGGPEAELQTGSSKQPSSAGGKPMSSTRAASKASRREEASDIHSMTLDSLDGFSDVPSLPTSAGRSSPGVTSGGSKKASSASKSSTSSKTSRSQSSRQMLHEELGMEQDLEETASSNQESLTARQRLEAARKNLGLPPRKRKD